MKEKPTPEKKTENKTEKTTENKNIRLLGRVLQTRPQGPGILVAPGGQTFQICF
jgi:hypothetical protein